MNDRHEIHRLGPWVTAWQAKFAPNNPTTNSSLLQLVFVHVISVALLISVAQINGQTQAEVNAVARSDFARADADLNKTYQSVLAKLRDPESKQKLREAQRAWVTSRDAAAARGAKEAEGGSMAPTLRYETMTHLTQERIRELKAMLDHGTESEPKSAASSVTPSPASTPGSSSEHAQSLSEPEQTPSSSSSSVSPDKEMGIQTGDQRSKATNRKGRDG